MNEGKCGAQALKDVAEKYWYGILVSGRYGQPGDQSRGFLVKTLFSIPYTLRPAKDFDKRTCLPHHDETAVDDETKPDGHILHDDEKDYRAAYGRRRQAAVKHIGKSMPAGGNKSH